MAVSAWAGPVTATTLAAPTEPSGLFAGAANVSALRVGTSSVSSVRLGSGQAWPTVTAPAAAALSYPADAGFIDVTADPYNAVGDGIADDTAAIQQALDDWDWLGTTSDPNPAIDRAAPKTIYLPAGTYRVTGPLYAVGSTVRIVGAGQSLTTIKLSDSNANFQTGTSKYLLRTGEALSSGQENAGFSNYISDLTLDVGAGNPAATGCRFSVANTGSMRRVTIRSSDATKRGLYGLMFGTTAGPGWVSDVTIDGFDIGIHTEGNNVNSIVFTDVALLNQRQKGVDVGAKSLAFEGLTITGAPLGIDVIDVSAMIVVDGLTVTGPGSGPAVNLVAGAYAWFRDVAASGWTNLITQGGTARFTGRTSITEWASANYRVGNTSTAWTENNAYVSLNLPKTRAPVYEQYNHSKWACPQDFGYTSGDVGPALQLAVNSGAEVVYLPYARYTLLSAVTLQGAVRKLEGMFSVLERQTGGSFTIGDNSGGHPIIVQNLATTGSFTFVHNSTGAVVVSDIGNRNGHTSPAVTTGAGATGDLFVESIGSAVRIVISRPISAWLRQLNRERAELVISGGASVRNFGDNVELSATDVEADTTVTDSTLEVLGSSFDLLNFAGAYPSSGAAAFAAANSTISVIDGGFHRSSSMDHWVSDGAVHVYAADTYVPAAGTNYRATVALYRSA